MSVRDEDVTILAQRFSVLRDLLLQDLRGLERVLDARLQATTAQHLSIEREEHGAIAASLKRIESLLETLVRRLPPEPAPEAEDPPV